ncbi:hypothetical protein QAD02_018357 [Eretmocerus hayati]|uniref:Uncharacterized protein n=1 Tax=Eretmocerus hayati TaxID=131215 RepID=A0ACC2PGL6_9HYME|nr:hypothetical protein QAD02_018357 [Eretmocerus hayati]
MKEIKTGDNATFVSLINEDGDLQGRKVWDINVTVINEEDCRNLLKPSGQHVWLQESSLCTSLPLNHPCPTFASSALVVKGRLIGLLSRSTFLIREPSSIVLLQVYVDVTRYNHLIGDHKEFQSQILDL